MLRVHTKKYFDPFCRCERKKITIHERNITTNVGQIVFFKWFVSSVAYDELYKNYETIVLDMKIYNKYIKRRRQLKCEDKSYPKCARKDNLTNCNILTKRGKITGNIGKNKIKSLQEHTDSYDEQYVHAIIEPIYNEIYIKQVIARLILPELF